MYADLVWYWMPFRRYAVLLCGWTWIPITCHRLYVAPSMNTVCWLNVGSLFGFQVGEWCYLVTIIQPANHAGMQFHCQEVCVGLLHIMPVAEFLSSLALRRYMIPSVGYNTVWVINGYYFVFSLYVMSYIQCSISCWSLKFVILLSVCMWIHLFCAIVPVNHIVIYFHSQVSFYSQDVRDVSH
jgi:hypothetical protein